MGNPFSRLFPPHVTLTEQNLPSQKRKVFIVTGDYYDIGYELVEIIFRAGGIVYVAGSSEAKAQECIEELEDSVGDKSTAGRLEYLPLQLDDLSTIKASVEAFKAKESKLDVLWNTSGVALPPNGTVSKQEYEFQMATNCLGPLLFTQLLVPLLQSTARESPPGSVRIVWTSDLEVHKNALKRGIMTDLTFPPSDKFKSYVDYYVDSKVGNCILASEMGRTINPYGILLVVQKPGQLKTASLRHAKRIRNATTPDQYKANLAVYNKLWAGLAPELAMESSGGCYLIHRGKIHRSRRQDIPEALKSKEEGGTGKALEFQEWCNKQIAEFR